MGIERFFNSLRRDYNIVRDISPKDDYLLNSENLFFDFNSIVHVVSQNVLSLINNLMLEIIIDNNGCGNGSYDETKKSLGKLINDFSNPDGDEESTIQYFKEYFTKDKMDNIIIYFVSEFVIDLLSNRFKKEKLKLIYIAIDGVPSKAKIVEQKKRRFMGEFDKNIKKIILQDNKDKLNINKGKGCNAPFNKYRFLSNNIGWSKSNISPATSFMIKLDRYLKSIELKIKIKSVITGIDTSKIIISGYDEKDEAEKKIIDYINDPDNNINSSMCIYSPDADVILLSLLIKSNSIVDILRHDQQKSIIYKDPINAIYNVIKINDLKVLLFDYINIIKLDTKQTFNLDKQRVINDIVFVFTIFGDDFLHKIESFDVRNDIDIILDLYKENILNLRKNNIQDTYILKGNKTIEINYNNFVSLFEVLVEKEDSMIQRNFYVKKYQNYKRLVDSINEQLKEKPMKNIKVVDNSNIGEFINIFNYNQNIKYFVDNIIKLINKFIMVEVNPNKKTKYRTISDNITWHNINLIPINDFITFYKRVYNVKVKYSQNEYNQDIYNKLKSNILNNKGEINNLTNLLREYLDRDTLFNRLLNIDIESRKDTKAKMINKDYIDGINDIQLIDEIIIYFYYNKKFPKTLDDYIVGFNIPKIKYIYLKEYDNSLLSPYHKRITNNFTDFEKDIYKYERMLDEYQNILNKTEEAGLGDPSIDISESRNTFYSTYFGDDKDKAIQNYLDGLQWIVDYYYNDITYHKWYYMYNKSPLLKEILSYLQDNKTIFSKSKEILESCCLVTSSIDMLTPFEQLIYITPFNKKGNYIEMFDNYSIDNKKKIKQIITKIFGSSEYNHLYPNIDQIAKEVYENDTNTHIDCRGVYYLNKCVLNVVHDSNMIDETNIRELIRDIMSVDDQQVNTVMVGGFNDFSLKYNKYKKLFIMTGELKYKNKYKSIKKILNDIK